MADDPTLHEEDGKIPLTREGLYEFVWAQPMVKVAARHGVSSSYLARVCTAMNVPRPQRGYWAKLAFGKTAPVPPLLEARPGDHLAWSPGGGEPIVARPLPRPLPRQREEGRSRRRPARTSRAAPGR